MRLLAACLLVYSSLALPARAVVSVSADGSGNGTAPANDPGFNNVGTRGSGTAEYLGNGWVITAAHVGDGTTFFGGNEYFEVPNSAVQLRNPAGLGYTTYSDLLLYQIQSPPSLPKLAINTTPLTVGLPITMIGYGRERNSSEAYWDASWNPTSAPGAFAGYIWSTTNSMHWGTNVIDAVNVIQGVGSNSEAAFMTSFSAVGTANEAQGSPGDSGGGVFAIDPTTGRWSLGGIMFSTSNLPAQPWGLSAFGDLTYSADLYPYRNQINQIVNGTGDVNNDGIVNGLDIATVAAHWLETGTGAQDPVGDANHDGLVNGLDIARVASTLYQSSGGEGTALLSAPEPATFGAVVSGLITAALLCIGRRLVRRWCLVVSIE